MAWECGWMDDSRDRYPLVWIVLGLALACVPAFASWFTICGISGCSGGGFGRSTDPNTTLALLVTTGAVAALPAAVHALVKRSPRLLAGALVLGLVAAFVAGLIVGSDFRGCPRNVERATCLDETRP